MKDNLFGNAMLHRPLEWFWLFFVLQGFFSVLLSYGVEICIKCGFKIYKKILNFE